MFSNSAQKAPTVQKIEILPDSAGQRLDNFLVKYLKGVPKSRIYRIIRKGEVRINQGRAKPDYKLNSGDVLRIPPIRQTPPKESALLSSLSSNKQSQMEKLLDNILFEDKGLLVINKPSGIAVHGGSGLSLGIIEAVRHLKGKNQSFELVHRLDRGTSGCLMIAKSRRILKILHEQLKARTVEKVYWALVEGQWDDPKVVCAPLKKNQLSSGERFVRVAEDGQEAITEFTPLQRFNNATLVEARPKTGRTHQIRVHAAFSQHPIIGDEKYGSRDFNQHMKKAGFNRLCLHARTLSFRLPDYPEMITVEAPLEISLERSLIRLQGG
jgi:23S rRNA pseudouridine955/2504/2580 synthase